MANEKRTFDGRESDERLVPMDRSGAITQLAWEDLTQNPGSPQ